VETDDDSIGGHFPAPAASAASPSKLWVRSMHTSLNLYAEHEFNASTFTARVIAGTGSGHVLGDHRARSARLKGPKHGGANEFAFDTIGRYDNRGRGRGRHREAHRREADRHRASAIRSTPSPTRATRSSRKSRAASRRMRRT
jgi:2-methylcitrate synthase